MVTGNALETGDLTVFLYGASGLRKVLGGVDLTVRSGRALALLGESGSGKTLLIHSVLGLHGGVPGIVSGTATLLGVDLFRGLWDLVDYEEGLPPRIWKDCTRWHHALGRRLFGVLGRSVTLVPQDPATALSPFHTVGRMLEVAVRVGRPGISRREAREEGRDWLERIHIYGVPDVMGRYAHELSGGMAQRLALALALAPGPGLLVADEPTTGLDATLRVRILELLGHINETYGATLLLITHDTEAARLLAQDAAILCAGRIVEAGPAAVVLDPTARPKHPHTRFLLEAEQRLSGFHPEVSVPPPAWEGPTHDDYRVRCQHVGPECGNACPELRPVGQDHRLACHKELP